MKMTIEIDCTPVEARGFFGMPDVTSLNDQLVAEMGKRMETNMAMIGPEMMMKTWMSFGGQATEQFRQMMTTAAGAAMGGGASPKA